VLRFQGGDCVTGNLEVISSTGGLLCLSKPLILGTRIKVMFLTPSGPVLGAEEMLSPISSELPFVHRLGARWVFVIDCANAFIEL
jgi:hypothetical protein